MERNGSEKIVKFCALNEFYRVVDWERYSTRELGKLTGLTNVSIHKIQNKHVTPSVQSINKILDVFGYELCIRKKS